MTFSEGDVRAAGLPYARLQEKIYGIWRFQNYYSWKCPLLPQKNDKILKRSELLTFLRAMTSCETCRAAADGAVTVKSRTCTLTYGTCGTAISPIHTRTGTVLIRAIVRVHPTTWHHQASQPQATGARRTARHNEPLVVTMQRCNSSVLTVSISSVCFFTFKHDRETEFCT